jgi:hypothetical protein
LARGIDGRLRRGKGFRARVFCRNGKPVKMKIEAHKGENLMSTKRHEGSLHGNKKKKRVKGCVDRVTGGIVVVLIKDEEDPDVYHEVYVPISKFKNRTPQEGDYVSVEIEDNS